MKWGANSSRFYKNKYEVLNNCFSLTKLYCTAKISTDYKNRLLFLLSKKDSVDLKNIKFQSLIGQGWAYFILFILFY